MRCSADLSWVRLFKVASIPASALNLHTFFKSSDPSIAPERYPGSHRESPALTGIIFPEAPSCAQTPPQSCRLIITDVIEVETRRGDHQHSVPSRSSLIGACPQAPETPAQASAASASTSWQWQLTQNSSEFVPSGRISVHWLQRSRHIRRREAARRCHCFHSCSSLPRSSAEIGVSSSL